MNLHPLLSTLIRSKKASLTVDYFNVPNGARFTVTDMDGKDTTWPLSLTREELEEMVVLLRGLGESWGVKVDVFIAQHLRAIRGGVK